MEQRRLRSGAGTDTPRVHMLSGWALGGITLMVAATLALVFPRHTLIEQVQREDRNDALAFAYLTNLLKTEPKNVELRLLLAQKRLAAGATQDTLDTLAPLKVHEDRNIRRRAVLLEFRALDDALRNQPQGGTARNALVANLGTALRQLAALEWPAEDLLFLARRASALGESGLGRALFARLLASRERLAPDWLSNAAAAAEGEGHYRIAADLLFAAQARAGDRESRRGYFLRGVAVLQSGNLLHEALEAADRHLGDLADDDAVLQFLARLALAASDPARAQRYMRLLLRMSWADHVRLALSSAMDLAIAPAQAAEEDRPRSLPGGMRPYDERIYTLAFEVFLANRSLADAHRIAAAAVHQVPDALVWRERLAQVCEWTGKPAEALQQWLHLARKTGSDAAFQAILRLAPGLNDDAALLYAWKHEITRRKPDAGQWRAIVDLYERLGQPQDGVQFLESAYAANPDPLLLELMAHLEDRAGRIDEAIKHFRRLIAASGSTPQRATALATLYLAKSDFSQAYALLNPLRSLATPQDLDYWRLLADLAWQLQQDETALSAYGVIATHAQAEPQDMERLVALMRSRSPQEAARLAQVLYRKAASPSLLITAAEIYWQQRDLIALKRLYADLGQADEARFAANSYFYALRAGFFQASGQARAALADYERALAIDPEKTDLRTGLLWLLIDARNVPELRRRLHAYRTDALANSVYWAPYAAAYMSLSEPGLALPWYAREAPMKQGDYLWLQSYADALEAAGSAGEAWRVRRHAWAAARHQRADARPEGRASLIAYARLLTQFAPGDASLAILRHLLRQSARPEQPLDAAAKELVLAWTLSSEQHEAARIWLWQQYGRNLAKPLWAEIGVALAQEDVDTLDRLLQTRAEAMSPHNRIDAARALGDRRLAQDYAFTALERTPHDDELHLRLATDLLAAASSVITRDTGFTRGVLSGREKTASLNLWITPRLRLTVELGTIRQTTQDAEALRGVPGAEHQAGVAAFWRHARGETGIGIARRSALAEFNALQLTHTATWTGRLGSNFGLTQRERASETVPLAVGGHRDRVVAGISYAFSKREYLRAEGWRAAYHTQRGQNLGTGRGVGYEIGHRLRTEYPDLNLRYSGTIQHYGAVEFADAESARFTRDGSIPPGGFFLPQSFRLQGISLGLGTSTRDGYTGALRPYADFGRSHNSLSGNGYNWLLGAAGSLLGPDNLSFYFTRSRGGGGTNISVKEFGLYYRYFFDRY